LEDDVAPIRILLVDDDEFLRTSTTHLLQTQEFDVTAAASVAEALKLIISNTYDVLLSDLHMPGAGDGLTVVSAMRHANPNAIRMLWSAFPEMDAAARAILEQTDEVMVKPLAGNALVAAIRRRLAEGPGPDPIVESVASILERSSGSIIQDWYEHIETEKSLMAIPMTQEQRCHHLLQVFRDLGDRLRFPKDLGTKEQLSKSSAEHGENRYRQGYTAAMLVEESRQLQVSIFRALQQNLRSIDFSVLLIGVMAIADEVDSQLSQAMTCYSASQLMDAQPA
jgi:DNA-binding response OmpR family regulator